jgi:ABC-type proline/glycine betaine transport system substrate-binding protein
MFTNIVDNTITWYTPEGMTAAEIMQIPKAKKFMQDEEGAELYIKQMAEQKKKDQAGGVFQD